MIGIAGGMDLHQMAIRWDDDAGRIWRGASVKPRQAVRAGRRNAVVSLIFCLSEINTLVSMARR